jgi:hypothetical protein
MNPKVQYRVRRSSPLDSVLSQINLVLIHKSHIIKPNFNIIPQSTPRSPSVLLSGFRIKIWANTHKTWTNTHKIWANTHKTWANTHKTELTPTKPELTPTKSELTLAKPWESPQVCSFLQKQGHA